VRDKPGVRDDSAPAKPQPQRPPDEPLADDELPSYTISQQRKAFEQANLLELERKQKEGQLLEREDVERAWANTIGRVKSRILATASAAKQRIPHLDPEEVEILKDMLREALFELASEGER
jgi:phage terminase Nu1 subunit (DNA packaging protein)